MDNGTERSVAHVRQNVLGDPDHPRALEQLMGLKAMTPGGMGATTPEARKESQEQMGYCSVSGSLRDALGELIVAGRIGAGDSWQVMLRREVVRHERIKDTAILALIKEIVEPTHKLDTCPCATCFLVRYATAALSEEARQHEDLYLEALNHRWFAFSYGQQLESMPEQLKPADRTTSAESETGS